MYPQTRYSSVLLIFVLLVHPSSLLSNILLCDFYSLFLFYLLQTLAPFPVIIGAYVPSVEMQVSTGYTHWTVRILEFWLSLYGTNSFQPSYLLTYFIFSLSMSLWNAFWIHVLDLSPSSLILVFAVSNLPFKPATELTSIITFSFKKFHLLLFQIDLFVLNDFSLFAHSLWFH